MKKAMFLERKCAPEDFWYTLRFTDFKMYKVYGEEKHDGKYYLLVKNDSGTKELVPKDCFVVENGYCNIAEAERLEDLKIGSMKLRVLTPRTTGIGASRKTIDVVLLKQIGEKLVRIMDSKGSKYFVILKRKSSFRNAYEGHVVVSYENSYPSVGGDYKFFKIVSRPSRYSNKSLHSQEYFSIKRITHVKRIGKRWLEIGGYHNGFFTIVYARLPQTITP